MLVVWQASAGLARKQRSAGCHAHSKPIVCACMCQQAFSATANVMHAHSGKLYFP